MRKEALRLFWTLFSYTFSHLFQTILQLELISNSATSWFYTRDDSLAVPVYFVEVIMEFEENLYYEQAEVRRYSSIFD